MYHSSDEELGLGKHESAHLWSGDNLLQSRPVQVRGDHLFDEVDLGTGDYFLITPQEVLAAAGTLLAPRVWIYHIWEDSHPQDTSAPCDIRLKVGGWRPQTDTEKSQIALCRSGEYYRRAAAARAEKDAAALERQATAARGRANRLR